MKVKDRFTQKQDWMIGLSVAMAALALYVTTLAPTVLEADAGEFQFVPWLPGIAHPTGYPLYVLLGWLWTHLLPVGEVAWRMNLLSALFAAATVGVTYGVIRHLFEMVLPITPWSARAVAAAGTAAIFGLTRTFWSQAIMAEVYALHTLFVAALLWLALRWYTTNREFGSRTAKALTFTLGLSLTHHATTVLLLPALALFVFLGRREKKEDQLGLGIVLTHSLLFFGPLLLYLYLPLIAPVTPYTTLQLSESQTLVLYDNSAAGLWAHITGTVFAAALQPAAAGWDRLLLTWELLRQQVGWVGAILAGLGLLTLWQGRHRELLVLTGVAFLAVVGFNLIYFIGDVFVLFIPAWLLICLWLGLGMLALAHRLANAFVRRKTRFTVPVVFDNLNRKLRERIYRLVTVGLLLGGTLVFVGYLAMRNIEIGLQGNTAARDQWLEILQEPMAQSAVLISNDRNEMMPLWYYQYVEGHRPDLLGLFPLIVTDPAYRNVGRVLDQALASGRPVYLVKPMPGLALKANLTPEGKVVRATGIEPQPVNRLDAELPPIKVPGPASNDATETIKLLGYDVRPGPIFPGDEFTVTLYWQPTEPLAIDYTSYVHLVDKDGEGITQNDHRPGGYFHPSHAWQVGEILRDRHLLTVPPDLPPGTYQLRAGIYYQPEPGQINGSGIELGSVVITGR